MSLASVYAQVPHVPCKGLCQRACGPIACADIEAQDLQNNGISLPRYGHHDKQGEMTCSHLGADGRCRIYENRPLICRLYGAVKKLQCEHGCKPVGGWMSDDLAGDLVRELNAATGREPYVATA